MLPCNHHCVSAGKGITPLLSQLAHGIVTLPRVLQDQEPLSRVRTKSLCLHNSQLPCSLSPEKNPWCYLYSLLVLLCGSCLLQETWKDSPPPITLRCVQQRTEGSSLLSSESVQCFEMLQTNPSMPLIPSAVLYPFHLQNHLCTSTELGTHTFLCSHQHINVFWTILAIILPYPGRNVHYRHEEPRVNQDLYFSSPSMLCFQLSLADTAYLNYFNQAPSPLWEIRLQVQCGLQSLPEK